MARTAILLFSSLALAAANSYEQPYYSSYGDHHKNMDKSHGGYEADQHGYGSNYGVSDYGGRRGAEGYYAGKYGEDGRKNGEKYYAKGDEHGNGDEAHEDGFKKNGGAYGGRKFSYFSSGSGPYGSFQKGYYGSEGYEHDNHKSKYSSHAEDNGFKKGYDGQGAKHDDKYSSYDKEDASNKKHESKYDVGKYGSKSGGYGNEGREEGWQNEQDKSSYSSKEHGKPYY